MSTPTSIALRLSFQVPEFSATGKLKGFRLEHVVKRNIVDEQDYGVLFNHDVQKLVEAVDGMFGGALAIQRKFKLTDEQAKMVRYSGVSIARHETDGPAIPAVDERWV
jgi:hypothetical protein